MSHSMSCQIKKMDRWWIFVFSYFYENRNLSGPLLRSESYTTRTRSLHNLRITISYYDWEILTFDIFYLAVYFMLWRLLNYDLKNTKYLKRKVRIHFIKFYPLLCNYFKMSVCSISIYHRWFHSYTNELFFSAMNIFWQ